MTLGFEALPSHWKRSRVDRVATVNARIGWKALTAEEYQDDGYVFLATPNIKSTDIDFTDVNYISEFRYRESPDLKLRRGDVLLAKDGNTLGITNIVVDLPRPATVNGSIAVLRPYGIEGRFLRYALASTVTQGAISAIKGGMGVPHLFQWDIKRLAVPLPPLAEQRRIADFLDTETAWLDRLAQACNEQLDALAERSFAAISETLIPGTLTRPLGNYPYPWLPAMPADTRLTRLGYVCRLQNGVTVDEGRARTDSDVTRPYLRVANVQAGHVALDSVTEITVPKHVAKRSTLRAGDVLMTEGGDLDKLGRGTVWRGELASCLHQNHVFALRPELDKLDADYLALMTQTAHGRCYFESTGTKTTNLASTNSSKILSFPVPLPKLQTQHELVRQVQKQQKTEREARQALTRQSALLAERRQALITAAVTGKIDVTTARGAKAS